MNISAAWNETTVPYKMVESSKFPGRTSKTNWLTRRHNTVIIFAVFIVLIKYCEGALSGCPIGFQLVRRESSTPLCYKLKPAETYGEKYINCHGNMDDPSIWRHFDEYKRNELKIWTDFLRLNENGVLISWSLGDTRMGTPLKEYSVKIDEDFDNGKLMCTVLNMETRKLNSVDCNDKYERFCVVDAYVEEPKIDDVCPSEYMKFDAPHTTCIQLPSNNNTSLRHAPVRATWKQAIDKCKKSNGYLLEKGYIYANHPVFIAEQATQWELPLGIIRQGMTSFFWSNYSNGYAIEKINQKDWRFASDVSFENMEKYVALRNENWILLNESTIFYFVVCEHSLQLPKPNIVVAYESNGMLVVDVNNTKMTQDHLWCFTDSMFYYPIRVQITNVQKSNSFIIETEKDGYYWCVSINTTTHSPQESNRELFYKDKSSLERLYATMLMLDDEYDEKDLAGLEISIGKRLNEFLYYRKMMAQNFGSETTTSTNKKPTKRNRMQVILDDSIYGVKTKRIYEDRRQILVHVSLGGSVDVLPQGEWKGITILYMRRAYFCEKNDSLPQIHLGGYHEFKNSCISYKCSGDYNVGAYWEMYNNNENCLITTAQSEQRHPSKPVTKPPKTTTTITTTTPESTTVILDTTESPPGTTVLPVETTPEEQIMETVQALQELANRTDLQMTNLIEATTQISNVLNILDVDIPTNILTYLETIVRRVTLENDTLQARVIESNIAVIVVDNRYNHYVGMKLDNISGRDELTNNSIQLITEEQAPSVNINDTTTEIYVKIPKILSDSNERISFVLFRNDRAFTPNNSEAVSRVNSRILSISISNETNTRKVFPENNFVYIHLRPFERELLENETRQCVFWDFQMGELGGWSTEGCMLIKSEDSSLDICRCNHLTHFAEIIGTKGVYIGELHNLILTVITFVGCTLSLIGLVLIGLTGALFRSWRREFTNKIWLHLSASIALLILSFFIISSLELETMSTNTCIAVGVILHYSLLASFTWMLISAVVSYQRLVTVFVKNTSHRLLKACIFAWGFPWLFIGALLITDPYNYVDHLTTETISYTNKFCYPSGLGYWFAVFLPILITVAINTVLFVCIIYSVFISTKVKRHGDSQELFRSITVSFLLFFMFGLTWIFGMLSTVLVFNYLFCITGTLQGFVLFLFFVIGNKKSRGMWLEYLRLKERRRMPVTTSTTSRVSAYRHESCNGRGLGKFEDSNATKPRSLSGVIDNSRFS